MPSLIQIETGDRRLLESIAETLAEAARRSGDWLVCRPGCTQCCVGPFAITQLDVLRLHKGLANLQALDPARAGRVKSRSAAYVAMIAPEFPGDTASGELFDEDLLPTSTDELPCPALDPDTGTCELYESRPVRCRTFGPVTYTADETLAACELCYIGATDDEMAGCAVEIDSAGLESELLASLESAGQQGMTIVAYALTGATRPSTVNSLTFLTTPYGPD